jgi:hypothetical protein
MEIPAVYPWQSELDGVCGVMADRAIWEKDLPPILMRSLRKVLKTYLAATGGKPYNPEFDRLRFSTECVAILSSAAYRRQVMDLLVAGSRNDAYPARPLARVVWEHALRNGAIDIEQFCSKHDDDRHYLVPEKFAPWVAARPAGERERKTTALVGCAYAILQPTDAPAIAAALAAGGDELVKLMGRAT